VAATDGEVVEEDVAIWIAACRRQVAVHKNRAPELGPRVTTNRAEPLGTASSTGPMSSAPAGASLSSSPTSPGNAAVISTLVSSDSLLSGTMLVLYPRADGITSGQSVPNTNRDSIESPRSSSPIS
jgi:hypothetical protein